MILGFPPLFPPFGKTPPSDKDLQKKLIDLQNALHESGQKNERLIVAIKLMCQCIEQHEEQVVDIFRLYRDFLELTLQARPEYEQIDKIEMKLSAWQQRYEKDLKCFEKWFKGIRNGVWISDSLFDKLCDGVFEYDISADDEGLRDLLEKAETALARTQQEKLDAVLVLCKAFDDFKTRFSQSEWGKSELEKKATKHEQKQRKKAIQHKEQKLGAMILRACQGELGDKDEAIAYIAKECGISVDEVSVLYENKKQTM